MEVLRLVLRYAHLIGFALLLGAAIAQYVSGRLPGGGGAPRSGAGGALRINQVMVWGALTQLVTGLALAAPLRDEGDEPAPAKLAVKLGIALLIAVAVWVPRKRPEVARGHFLGIVGMTLINAAVATFW